jgi:light-regulated signal transduction histidine kinase (bacteriophytochrome)
MDTPQKVSARTEPTVEAADQSARLLGHLRRVLSHDLGNQLVAVQGLLQVLQLEEEARLSADSQDYLNRATAACRRAQTMIQALKELAHIGSEKAPREALRLDELAREIVAEVKALRPACVLKWRLGADALHVAVRRRELSAGLRRLACSLAPEAATSIRIEIHSRRTAAGVELSVGTAAATPASNQLDWILAQELLAGCGGTLCVRPEPGQGHLLTLTMPPGEGMRDEG